MDLLDGLKVFVATAQTGSFTAAGGQLGMSNRLTSKYVGELEARLGVRLFQRTTRKVGLTPAGTDLLARAPALLDDLDEMLAEVSEGSRGFSGTIRITAPVTFGEVYVVGMLGRFAARHPNLTLDLRLNDGFADLATEGIDLALRIGETRTLSVKTRKLCLLGIAAAASPDYLARHGAPKTPQDLANHACIVDTNRRTPGRWTFRDGAHEIEIAVTGAFRVNSARAACNLAVDGKGIVHGPKFALRDALKAGRLVQVLADFPGEAIPLSAAYLEGRSLPRKIRALIEFAQADIRDAGVV